MKKVALFTLVAVSCALGALPASACSAQKGKAIFTDDFSDDSGGWEANAAVSNVNGADQVRIDGKAQYVGVMNGTFNATAADYCMEAQFPLTPTDPKGYDEIALDFFSAGNTANTFSFGIGSTGEFWISRVVDNHVSSIVDSRKSDAIKSQPGSLNALRIVVRGQKATFYINEQQVKVLRFPPFDTANRFGFFAGSSIPVPSGERDFLVKSFQVSETE